MQVVTENLIKGKTVLLRYDIDVEIQDGKVVEPFRLKKGLKTLDLCLEHANKVILMGHVGRPEGEDPVFSVEPIYDWLMSFAHYKEAFDTKKLRILENLRFEPEEDDGNLTYAKELASYGDFYINEAFAAYHKAASTTVLPTLLPHAAGLNFAKEVERLTELRNNPKKPLIALIGGAKVEGKYRAVVELSKLADKVLVGGLLARNIKEKDLDVPENVKLATLSEDGLDISPKSIEEFVEILKTTKEVVWGGPMGKYEVLEGNHGDKVLALTIVASGAESIIGGGDTVAALDKLGILEKFSFVSTGGGAMLEFLSEGTLATIDALNA
jgi:phosphoglycerate kinase